MEVKKKRVRARIYANGIGKGEGRKRQRVKMLRRDPAVEEIRKRRDEAYLLAFERDHKKEKWADGDKTKERA